jgi:hypothetical protein
MEDLVQDSAYRGSSHRRNVASSHILNMVWLFRKPNAVGMKGPFTCGHGGYYLPLWRLDEWEGGDSTLGKYPINVCSF